MTVREVSHTNLAYLTANRGYATSICMVGGAYLTLKYMLLTFVAVIKGNNSIPIRTFHYMVTVFPAPLTGKYTVFLMCSPKGEEASDTRLRSKGSSCFVCSPQAGKPQLHNLIMLDGVHLLMVFTAGGAQKVL
jgi:hypothetical protein